MRFRDSSAPLGMTVSATRVKVPAALFDCSRLDPKKGQYGQALLH
jgi:hypothetical protein